MPENSKTALFVSLGLLIGGPIAIDLTSMVLERKGKHPGAWLKQRLGFGKTKTIEEAPAQDAKEVKVQGAKNGTESNSRKQTVKKKGRR